MVMSFKLFIYYCAVCGSWAALLACALVLGASVRSIPYELIQSTLIAGILGLLLASAVGAMDALLNAVGWQRFVRVFVCLMVGLVGGLCSGLIGQLLQWLLALIGGERLAFRFPGWVLVGIAIGASIGTYDLLRAIMSKQGIRQAIRKVANGLIGGFLGGLVGGLLYDGLDMIELKTVLPRTSLALGLVILGTCIGLLIGLAQVILKEASIRVEAGFRAGRQMLLTKPETVIGRAESCDLGLFGDNGIERTHARIKLLNNRYVLEDAGTAGGTFLNDQRITTPTPLRSGDAIRVGNSVLRFEERQKRN